MHEYKLELDFVDENCNFNLVWDRNQTQAGSVYDFQ